MADVSKLLRQKRFKLKDQSDVRLQIETSTGARLELRVENCSLGGLGAFIEGDIPKNEALEPGVLIPTAKLLIERSESSLGRLVLRRITELNGKTYLAFSTVDMRLPIDGPLSRFIAEDLETRKTPYEFEISPMKFSVRNFMESNQPNVDLFNRAKQFQVFFDDWINSTKFQYHNVRSPSKGVRVKLNRTRGGNRRDYVVMGSNDYLGLAAHEKVIEASKKALDEYGLGSTGSPVATGLTDLHEELCDELARMLRMEKVLLFNSGYAANVGIITGLTSSQDIVIADILSHASILDAMQMSQATSRFFKHNDSVHLEKLLRENRSSHNGALVATEGVFSMNGDVPPLSRIAAVAKAHNARLMVDEAHSFGVIGPTGLGCWEQFPDAKVDMIMGTFSKVCGSIGGFLACDKEVANWLFFNSRPHLFSVSLPPSVVAGTIAALRIFRQDTTLVQSLQANIRHFTAGLRGLGFPIDPEHQSAVIPVVIGDEDKIFAMNRILWDGGVYVLPIVFPVVGRKECRFRFTIMANHTTSDLDYVLSVLEKAMNQADFKPVSTDQTSATKRMAA